MLLRLIPHGAGHSRAPAITDSSLFFGGEIV